jgi:phosphatidate phosphatase PAH1
MSRTLLTLVVTLAIALSGCPTTPEDPPCEPSVLVVTDIDETLTTHNDEWLAQLADSSYDPAMRPDADVLINGYADLGYAVLYLTGRGEEIELDDGRSGRQATADWLEDRGFPWSDEFLVLHDGLGATGPAALEYKSDALEQWLADGYEADIGYGNSEADIEAYLEVGMDPARLYLVGELAGTMAVEAIPDEDAYVAHAAAVLPTVDAVECDE